jgi:hypothetical protein
MLKALNGINHERSFARSCETVYWSWKCYGDKTLFNSGPSQRICPIK